MSKYCGPPTQGLQTWASLWVQESALSSWALAALSLSQLPILFLGLDTKPSTVLGHSLVHPLSQFYLGIPKDLLLGCYFDNGKTLK